MRHTVSRKNESPEFMSLYWILDGYFHIFFGAKYCITKGTGCDSVGRAVAYNTRSPRFGSRHRQNFYLTFFTVKCFEKNKIKKKMPKINEKVSGDGTI